MDQVLYDSSVRLDSNKKEFCISECVKKLNDELNEKENECLSNCFKTYERALLIALESVFETK